MFERLWHMLVKEFIQILRDPRMKGVIVLMPIVQALVFGYAVTTLAGELVRCNDTFARLFGFSDAPDALTRTAGQLFPGLAGRTTLLDRLTAEGHVDRVESCLERVDGREQRRGRAWHGGCSGRAGKSLESSREAGADRT